MKPKKQQPAEGRKQSTAASGDGTGESTQKATEAMAAAGSAVVTAPASTPAAAATTISAPSSSSSSKKPVKRLQAKAKDLTSVGSSVESLPSATPNTAAGVSGSGGGKPSEKLQSTSAGAAASVPVQSSKSKPSSVASSAGAKSVTSGPSEQQSGSNDGPAVESVTPSKPTPASKSSKGATKASKADSNSGSSAPSSASGKSGETKKKPSSAAAAKATSSGSTAKKGNSQAEKRKQSTAGAAAAINPSLETGTVAGATEAGVPAPAADRLREKEKKIQKELKNLGISDKTLHQIDAAYLRTTDESVNPSISEMVKTKSRTTVSQAKYSESQLAAGSSSTGNTGNGGRKSSVTSEDASGTSATSEGQQDKPAQTVGKTKKSVTLKLDSVEEKSTPAKGGKSSKEGPTGDSTGSKATPKGGQKGTGEGGGKPAAKAPPKGGSSSSGKSSKKSAATASGEGKQQSGQQSKKGATIGTSVAAVPKPQASVEDRKPVAATEGSKQVTFETSPLAGMACAGRSSSVEPDDPEEKNEAVQIQIDSIVKALEQEEDSDTVAIGDTKKDTPREEDDKKDPSAKSHTVSGPSSGGGVKKLPKGGDSDPKPAPRKPALKKNSSGANATKAPPSKEAGEKRKGTAFAVEKKEVTFKEQPAPPPSAKRKHVKKPKASGGGGGGGDDACGEAKPAKAAKVKGSSSKPKPKSSTAAAEGSSKPKIATDSTKAPAKEAAGSVLSISTKQQEPVPAPSEVTIQQKISSESQNSQDPPRVDTGLRKEDVKVASRVAIPSQQDRSSTENDDDLPLRQLQVKSQPVELPAPQSDSQSKAPSSVGSDGKELAEKSLEVQSSAAKTKSSAQTCAGPILASLLKSGSTVGKSAKRSYVRKPPTAAGAAPGAGGKSGKPPTAEPSAQATEPGSGGVAGTKSMDQRKLEKKDVYDFDDSDSDAGALVKGVKPSFKRKSSVDLCQSSREDISQLDDTAMQDASQAAAVEQPAKHEQDSDREAEKQAVAVTVAKASPVRCPAKKQKKRPMEVQDSKSLKLKTELKSGSSSSSEPEDGCPGVRSPVEKVRPLDQAPEAKVKKKVPAKRLKQESAKAAHGEEDSAQSSADDDDDDDDEVERDDQCDEVGEGEESDGDDSEDGYSSTDTVRTRIAKKRQSAKKRNLKLYGFWSGPKRHRVASLNAIAKVHCLYENERPAFEASLMKQSSGSRVIRTITKDGERIKKERICVDDESVEGGDDEGASGAEGASEEKGTISSTVTTATATAKSGSKQERKQEQPAPIMTAPPTATVATVAEQVKEEAKPTTTTTTAKVSVKQEPAKKEPTSNQDSSSESSEEEPVVTRTLRCVPGLRGAGKHWDPDASSMESDIEQLPDSDETYAQGKDTDPIRKRKVKKKVVRKSKAKTAAQTKQEKEKEKEKDKEKEKGGGGDGLKGANEKSEQKSQPKPRVKKIKKELKALLTDSERQDDGAASSSSTGSEKGTVPAGPASSSKAPKAPEEGGTKKRKREGPKVEEAANEVVTDYKEYIGKKRMASLNATAMLAATYEVQRTLYRNTDSSDSECSAEKAPKSKKAKDQKDAAAAKEKAAEAKEKKELAAKEKLEAEEAAKKMETSSAAAALVEPPAASPPDRKQVDLSIGLAAAAAASDANASTSAGQQEVLTKKKKVVIKTEPMRDRKDDPLEVKREIEEPRPVSSNLVIAQDTEVTITGVYVNATLGTNQEAYCKMQYRVQQSVTEERLVRPGEVPPKSYTPLSALSSMRPPNDQTLSTPPLFVPPVQCDSPLLVHGPPRSFYPPPTSSSGSSSAFCAPLPHDSPGYYQPAGPLISPHLLPPTTSQHGLPLGGSLVGSKSGGGPEHSEHSPLHHPGPAQPPASTTADSTDSDVLLTGGDLAPRVPAPYAHSHRYGPATGPPGPPPPAPPPPPPSAANLYQRPMQMHCPPPPPSAYLAANYYGSPYGQHPPPPPPHPSHHEMYYAHAYPAHFYPKFAPHQYYPTPSRRYYPGPPGPPPGSVEHLYEQAPPGGSPVGPGAPPPPPPPPSGAQLVPAGPQGPPQHLDHYPYPYPGYGSPGPGSGGQCYSRNPLQHPSPYMDAHYTTNCPCPMQCPKNVNAGSLIGIKASKGPVATNNNNTNNTTNNSSSSTNSTNNHIVQSQQPSTMASTEPITISSSSSSSSSTASSASSASPAPLDIHAPIVAPVSEPPVPTVPPSTASSHTVVAAAAVTSHGYHHHHHHHPAHHQPLQRPPPSVEMHHGHQYHPSVRQGQAQGPPVEYLPPTSAPATATVTSTSSNPSAPSSVHSSSAKPTDLEYPAVVTTAPSNGERHPNPARMCYKPEQPHIKPETIPEPHAVPPMHYGTPYHHHPHYHHPGLGYYHHPGLSAELKDDRHGPPLAGAVPTPYTVAAKMAHHEASPIVLPHDVSATRGAAKAGVNQMQPPRPLTPPDVLLDDAKRKNQTDDKQHTTIKAIVKQEIEEFKPDCLLAVADGGTVCKKENFEETGPAMTPELPLHESIVIKKDHDEQKPTLGLPDETKPAPALVDDDGSLLKPLLQPPHHPQPNGHLSSHHHHHHHHSASTNLLHHHLNEKAPDHAPAPGVEADSKCALTELVLTTEASLASKVSSVAITTASVTVTTTTSSSTSSTSTVPALVTMTTSSSSSSSSSAGSCTVSNHAKDISSDSSISISDSIFPSVDGDGDVAGLVEHDPASPISIIPASTVKRRPLLVACKKSTTKQSPPNSYKNLIKRTKNGDGENVDDAVAPVDDTLDGAQNEAECAARGAATVELSDEEEEDEDEEEEEDDEEEDEEGDDDEDEEEEEEDEAEGEEDTVEGTRGEMEDVEDVEMLEQARQEAAQRQRVQKRSRIASKIAICKRSSKMPVLIGHGERRKSSSVNGGSNNGAVTTGPRKLLLLTHQNRRKMKKPGTPVSRRLLKRVHRVFRTSIESLRKLPPRLGGGLLPARHQRFVRKLRLSKSPVSSTMTHDGTTCEVVGDLIDKQDASVVALHSGESQEVAVPSVITTGERSLCKQHEEGESTEQLSIQTTLADQTADGAITETTATSIPKPSSTVAPVESEPEQKAISNVDRTIDLVARGYFSEPEILPLDLKMHSRGWLKKVKQQQQQEGRSHSEQSRGAKRDRSSSSGGASTDASAGCTKKTKKATPAAPLATVDDRKNGTVETEKKSKSKTKKVPSEMANGTGDCDAKSKKKSSSKDSKKESKKKSKKQKLQADEPSSEQHRASDVAAGGTAATGGPIPIEDDLSCSVVYQRATSTPIPANGQEASIPEIEQQRRDLATPCVEDELRKVNHQLDDSGNGCQLDQSSVIDDRETDFDDAATMLVEDDVASVDTSVLITRHNNNNNNNNSAIIDKNNLDGEQQQQQQLATVGMIVPEQRPLQAIIADGKEGSELEPPEGMEPFLDDPMDETDDGLLRLQSPLYPQQQQQQQQQQPQQPSELNRQHSTVSEAMQLDYADEDEDDDEDALLLLDDDGHGEEQRHKRSSNHRSAKRRRSRSKSSKKFSSKKRHRPSAANRCEVEEIIVPRKSTSVPRWSNGWTWEGQPFQGKVFLNSDDAPVLRTCYPAMRHSEGDIIRPRDCVLLRAGSKRAELPYVAKVAHLWENPEDGEMMMSLLWYYRPEHTEQGRQLADGPDEVFASRHKDHNSVACIEDKCYVLTFSEYCRFRRQLKGLEENVEEQPSIVPPLRRENPRLPPPIVAPELVMYCQRVYEFRLKRLLKSTS
ncbi:uncharacterized protein LOC126573083 isoform X2 [Anopheles aquasalis]|uniref:uncharacterized protein LOC126573083 isoform X2 n=1 Tax=Anopheles aquasalis TaxID=42839 RepID=UPI00215A4132|nr:uncharacterized protein LOC126573083 isoform X2 [Anopheles aquasalis]